VRFHAIPANSGCLASISQHLKEIHPDWALTVYYRNPAADDYFKTVVKADKIVHGTFEDAAKVSAVAAEHEVVINSGSSFDPGLSKAIIDGLKRRTSGKGTLIHVSGGGNFIDHRTDGKFSPESKVWNVGCHFTFALVESRDVLNILPGYG
jgi:hypothetical protein